MLSVIHGGGGSFFLNLAIMSTVVPVAFCAQAGAVWVHAQRGWRRVLATVALNLIVLAAVGVIGHAQALDLIRAVIIVCDCSWMDFFCCLI